MPTPNRRRTPEELLLQAEAEEAYERRGKLKIFLGYASGVGKSFGLLDEGRRSHERGQDVIVGAIQLKTPPEVESFLSTLEVIPPNNVDNTLVMDVPPILKRHPGVCLVDGLAYDNPHPYTNHSPPHHVHHLLQPATSPSPS